MLERLWLPPVDGQALAGEPARPPDSERAKVSACRVPSESTGVVPERSLVPVPLAVSVQSVAKAVPPLSLISTLRTCSCSARALVLTVQMPDWPIPTVMLEPLWLPPVHDQALAE